MSGTSLDGVDAVLAREGEDGWRTEAGLTRPFPADLQRRLRLLCEEERVPLDEVLRLDGELAEEYAAAVAALRRHHPLPPGAIAAIGSHGQTIRHRPELGNSWQIGHPALLAERSGLPVVADFRRADLAAGGQGAPLAPLFHRALLWRGEAQLVVINIGGMANVSLIDSQGSRGFDSGPGNALMDAWTQAHWHKPWDDGGHIAASGRVHPGLLQDLLQHPFFSRPPPKSTGREEFHLEWLRQRLTHHPTIDPADVQATLCELTAQSIATAVKVWSKEGAPVLVCGGGVHNATLMNRLTQLLAPRPVHDTRERGIDPDHLEALGFAWLAAMRLCGMPLDTGPVTGAQHPVVLGAVYSPPSQPRSAGGT